LIHPLESISASWAVVNKEKSETISFPSPNIELVVSPFLGIFNIGLPSLSGDRTDHIGNGLTLIFSNRMNRYAFRMTYPYPD
jgi:hypothetical protein